MTYYVTLPDGTYAEFPDDVTPDQASAIIARQFSPQPQRTAENSGFVPAVKAGFQELYGQGALAAGKLGLIEDETAKRVYAEQEAKAKQTFVPTPDGWGESPWQKFKETAGGSLPYMVAPIAAGAAVAATPLTGAAATAAGLTAAGLTSAAQFTASNTGRQAKEGAAYEDLDVGDAALAAIPQALLDTLSMRMLPGVGRLLGSVGKEVTANTAQEFAKQTLKQVAADYAKATGKAMTAEGFTEAAQQVFERLQAGLNITDEKARAEYVESFIGGTVLGGAISPAGRFVERVQDTSKSNDMRQAQQEKEAADTLRQQQFAAIDANKAAAEQKALDLQRNVPTATGVEESGEEVATPNMIRTLNKAYEARAAAIAQAGDAARNGDIAGLTAARAEADKQAEVIRTLSQGKTDLPAPPSIPKGEALEDMQRELEQLQGTTNKKGKLVAGKIERALRSGENDVVDQHIARMQELQQKIADFTANADVMEQRTKDMQQGPTPDANPYAAYANTLEQTQQENGVLRQERGVDIDAERMAAARMDTSRTEQLSLMDDLKPRTTVVRDPAMTRPDFQALGEAYAAAKATGNKPAMQDALDAIDNARRLASYTPEKPKGMLATRVADTRPAATEVTFTPKDTTEKSLREQLARLPENMAPETAALVNRINANLPTLAAQPEQRAMVADWLHRQSLGPQVVPAGEASRVVQDTRARDITATLDALEQGKRSETEGGKTAIQTDMFPRSDVQGRVFPTPQAFNNFLGGEALQKMRVLGGQAGQTISRALKSLVPFQRKVEEIGRNVDVLAKAADWESQNQVAARARLGSVVQRMQQELAPLRLARVGAFEQLNEAAQHSLDIGQSIEANMRKMDPADGVGARLVAAANAAKSTVQQEVTKQNWDAARAAHKEVISALEAFRTREAQLTTDPNVLTFLNKDLMFQERLAREMRTVQDLQKRFDAADAELQRAQKVQANRRTDKADMRDAKAAVAESDVVAREAGAAVGEARDAQRAAQQTADAEKARVLASIEKRRDSVLSQAPTENQTDREAADGVQRMKEQDALERSDQGFGTPGERITFEARRRAQEVVDAAQPRKAQLETIVADPTTSEASRKAYTTELNKLKRAEAFLEANEGRTELVEKARKKFASLQNTTIPEQQALINAEGSTPQQVKKAKDRLRAAVKEATRLQTLMQMRDVERTPIVDRGEQQLQAEMYLREDRAQTLAERGTLQGDEETRLQPGRISQASKKERIAGDFRTGDSTTVDQRESGNRNPVREQRRVQEKNRAITPEEMQAANADSEAAKPAPTPAVAKTEIESYKAALETAKEKAEAAETQQGITPEVRQRLQDRVEYLTGKIAEKEAAAAKMVDDEDATAKMPNTVDPTTLAHADTRLALRDGDIMGTVNSLAETGSTAEVRRHAAALAPFLEGTKIGTDANVKYDGKEVDGLYQEGRNKITMNPDRLTEESIVHELTHAATATVLNTPDAKLEPHVREAKQGLTRMWEAMRNNPAFKGVYATESVKEFASEVYSNPALRKEMDAMGGQKSLLQRFATFIARMFGGGRTESEKAVALVEQILSPSRMHMKGESTAKVSPNMDAAEALGREMTEQRSKLAQLNASKSHLPLALEQKFVDMRAALRRTFYMGDKKLGTQAYSSLLTADATMNNLHSVAQYGAMGVETDAKGYRMLTSGHSKSAKDVFEAISAMPGRSSDAKMATFQAGITALRARDVGWETLDFADPVGMKAKGEAALAAINGNPEMKAAFDKARATYRDLNRGMIKALIATEAVTKETGEAMLADANYVPFYRENGETIDLITQNGHAVPIGDIRRQPLLHALKGGDSKLMPFQEAVFKNIALLTNMATQNLSNRHIAYHLQALGKDAGVMKIHTGDGPATGNVIRFMQKPVEGKEDDTGKRYVVIDTKGTAAEHIPTDLLAQSVAGSYATLPSFLKVAGWASDLLRSGVTRMPTYLVSQTFKDPFNASMFGNLKRNPIAATLKTLRNFGGNVTGKSADAMSLQKHGVLHSNIFNGDASDMGKIAMQILGNDQGRMARFFAGLDHVALTADAATREQHYRDVLNAGGSEAEAVIGAREMQNFNKRGSSASIQMLSRMIPFFNAGIQGLNVLAKSATGNMPTTERLKSKEAFYMRAMGMTGVALTYALMMEDDSDWQKMSLRDKMSNIQLPGGVRLPSPFESGLLFYSLPVALVEHMRGDFTKSDWKAVRQVMLGSVPGGGSIMPQLLKGVYDVKNNRNSFSEAPIVPRGLEGLDPMEQFNARTTEAAKRFAEMLHTAGVDLSPMQIEYLANAYVGQLPQVVAVLTNDIFAKAGSGDVAKPTKHVSDYPLIGRFVQGEKGIEDVTQAYDRAAEAIMAKDTFEKMKKSGRVADAKEYLDDNKADIALAPLAHQYKATMQKLKQAEDSITNLPKMSGDEKQKQLDRLNTLREQAAKKYNDAMRKIRAQLETSAA